MAFKKATKFSEMFIRLILLIVGYISHLFLIVLYVIDNISKVDYSPTTGNERFS